MSETLTAPRPVTLEQMPPDPFGVGEPKSLSPLDGATPSVEASAVGESAPADQPALFEMNEKGEAVVEPATVALSGLTQYLRYEHRVTEKAGTRYYGVKQDGKLRRVSKKEMDEQKVSAPDMVVPETVVTNREQAHTEANTENESLDSLERPHNFPEDKWESMDASKRKWVVDVWAPKYRHAFTGSTRKITPRSQTNLAAASKGGKLRAGWSEEGSAPAAPKATPAASETKPTRPQKTLKEVAAELAKEGALRWSEEVDPLTRAAKGNKLHWSEEDSPTKEAIDPKKVAKLRSIGQTAVRMTQLSPRDEAFRRLSLRA